MQYIFFWLLATNFGGLYWPNVSLHVFNTSTLASVLTLEAPSIFFFGSVVARSFLCCLMMYLYGRKYLELNAQVVLKLPHGFLVDDAEIPAAQKLPGAAGGRVSQNIVPHERPGHAAHKQSFGLYNVLLDFHL